MKAIIFFVDDNAKESEIQDLIQIISTKLGKMSNVTVLEKENMVLRQREKNRYQEAMEDLCKVCGDVDNTTQFQANFWKALFSGDIDKNIVKFFREQAFTNENIHFSQRREVKEILKLCDFAMGC